MQTILITFADPEYARGDNYYQSGNIGVLTGRTLSDASKVEVKLTNGNYVWVPRGNFEAVKSASTLVVRRP